MKIIEHIKSDWFRYGFETLAVIVGILSAFALESWRDNQMRQQEERGILVNLYSDLLDAKKQSAELIFAEETTRDYLIWALNLHAQNEILARDSLTDSIFYTVLWQVEMEVPIINAYSDIKNTGKTGLISNEQIRQRFTSLELDIYNLRNQIDDRLRVHQLRIDEISVSDMDFVKTISFRYPELHTPDHLENDYDRLLKDQKIRNLIGIKLDLTFAVIRYRRALEADIDTLISLLDDELKDF